MLRGRKEAQRHHRLLLRESQRGLAVFETVWDSSKQPVDYVIVSVNSKFAEIFGCAAETALRTRVSQSIPEIMRNVERSSCRRRSVAGVYRNRRVPQGFQHLAESLYLLPGSKPGERGCGRYYCLG